MVAIQTQNWKKYLKDYVKVQDYNTLILLELAYRNGWNDGYSICYNKNTKKDDNESNT